MQKIATIGPGGAGKSTFARQLGKALHIQVFHLDTSYWQPGRVPTPQPVWTLTQKEVRHFLQQLQEVANKK